MPDRHPTLVPSPAAPATYVKRRRTPGWRKPDGAISCTRGPVNVGRWGNPFRPGGEAPGGGVIATMSSRWTPTGCGCGAGRTCSPLRRMSSAGQMLMCWCAPGRACHVQDVLMPLVNEGRLP
jgi:hypothetical protein